MVTASRGTPSLAKAFEKTARRPLISVTEAARLTGISAKWLRIQVRRGAIKSHRLGKTGRYRIRCCDLAEWVERVNP